MIHVYRKYAQRRYCQLIQYDKRGCTNKTDCVKYFWRSVEQWSESNSDNAGINGKYPIKSIKYKLIIQVGSPGGKWCVVTLTSRSVGTKGRSINHPVGLGVQSSSSKPSYVSYDTKTKKCWRTTWAAAQFCIRFPLSYKSCSLKGTPKTCTIKNTERNVSPNRLEHPPM